MFDMIARPQHNVKQHREHGFTDFSWLNLCSFGHGWSSHIPWFLEYVEQYAWLYFISTLHTHACACNHTVLKHSTFNSARAKKVYSAWAQYGLPSVSLFCHVHSHILREQNDATYRPRGTHLHRTIWVRWSKLNVADNYLKRGMNPWLDTEITEKWKWQITAVRRIQPVVFGWEDFLVSVSPAVCKEVR